MRQIKRIVGKSWCGNVLRSVDLDPNDTEAENKIIAEMCDEYNIKSISVSIIDL